VPATRQSRLAHAERTELLARLQLGQQVLDCREPCLEAWRRAQPQAARLDAAAKWDDLAVLVMRTGYQDDLALYYLGRAAGGRGAYTAAAGYYRESIRLSGTSGSCLKLSHLCAGLRFPQAAAERLTAAERHLAQPKKRTRQPAAISRPASEPAASTETQAAEPTANAASPEPAAAPPTASAPDTAAASDYIEPPPASR
jgi:hypothetical protein